MTVTHLLPLALLGALLGLDVVSFPQAMISRPIVAATVAGFFVGAPGQGLIIGATLELFALETLPFGASQYPEWASASVVGGALFAAQPAPTAGALAVATCVALVTAWIGGWSLVAHRRLIAKGAARWRTVSPGDAADTVMTLQLGGLTLDLLRGGLLTAAAACAFQPLANYALAHSTVGAAPTRAVAVGLAGAVAGTAVWKAVHTTRGTLWYLLGGLALGAIWLS